MSSPSPSQRPQRPSVKRWSELDKAEKTAFIAILVVPVLCCFGAMGAFLGDDDPDQSTEEPTAVATSATESPSPTESPSERESPTPTEPAEASSSAAPPPSTEAATEEAVVTVYYDNCTDAWDAGAAPLDRDDPGYRSGLDRDGDGEACESAPSSNSGGDSGGDSGGGSGGDSGGGDDDDGDSSVYYKNCDAVRAAGAAPISKGQPGYGSHLDRDGDGVGCE